jgi:hypothetical protein
VSAEKLQQRRQHIVAQVLPTGAAQRRQLTSGGADAGGEVKPAGAGVGGSRGGRGGFWRPKGGDVQLLNVAGCSALQGVLGPGNWRQQEDGCRESQQQEGSSSDGCCCFRVRHAAGVQARLQM